MARSLDDLSFRTLFAASGNALLLADRLGCILESNVAARQLLGYSEEELTGQMVESLIPDYYLAQRYCDAGASNESSDNNHDQGLSARRRDGTHLQIELTVSDLQDPEYPYVLISLYDNTLHCLQERRFRVKAETQRAMIEHALVGIIQTDLLGNITQVNNCFCDITGYTREQLLNMNI